MANPKLGTKRQCPKCSSRFYDLGKNDPITCVSCEHQFAVEQVLKSRRPAAHDTPPAPKPVPKVVAVEDGEEGTDLVDDADDDDDDDDNLGSVLEIDDDDDDDPAIVVKIDTSVDG